MSDDSLKLSELRDFRCSVGDAGSLELGLEIGDLLLELRNPCRLRVCLLACQCRPRQGQDERSDGRSMRNLDAVSCRLDLSRCRACVS